MVRATLVKTDLPGVFRNMGGVLCDERGVALSFMQLKTADDARFTEVLGAPPTTPAELLRGVALDPRNSLDTRVHAARQAAPYFDRKMPLAIEASGSVNTGSLDMAQLAALPRAEREQLLTLLKKMGVALT